MFKNINCIPCEGGIPPLNKNEIKKFKNLISPDWLVIDSIKLSKKFNFSTYKHAIKFTNLVASLAVEQEHHPYIHINFKEIEIFIFTHKINGLHENDFLMANKIDHIYSKL